MSDIDKANRSRQHQARHDNVLNKLIGHREGRGTASAAVPSDVICSTAQHTLTPPDDSDAWYNNLSYDPKDDAEKLRSIPLYFPESDRLEAIEARLDRIEGVLVLDEKPHTPTPTCIKDDLERLRESMDRVTLMGRGA